MNHKVRIGNETVEVDEGTRLEDIAISRQREDSPLIVAAILNNKLRELNEVVDVDGELKFVDLSSLDGIRIYQRGLTFVFIRAAMELFYGIRLTMAHSVNKGLLFSYSFMRPLTESDIEKIRVRMKAIIDSGESFKKEIMKKEEAAEIFEMHNMVPKIRLLKYRQSDTISMYTLGWLKNYFYGYMVPDTSYIRNFDIVKFGDGIVLRHPNVSCPAELPRYEENPKVASIYKETEEWNHILGIDFVADLNDIIEESQHDEMVRVAEALHEKKVAQIADMIHTSGKRVILIAGPSSSGKTTFANRLMIQLKVNGLRPVVISTDNYFVDREETPVDENGEYDFESLKAVNVELFNEDLAKLLDGEEVSLPSFDFKKGRREYTGKTLKIEDDQPILIEGIHGLNEDLTGKIDRKDKFKIYISALTTLSIDEHNRIPTTDSRLIRRIVRDSRSRGHSAKRTIQLWPSVRKGEETNIFPFQEEADVMFNSSLTYEVSFLKKHAEPELREIGDDEPEYVEAVRLLKFLGYFLSIDDDNLIPNNSILREFVGGSCFKV